MMIFYNKLAFAMAKIKKPLSPFKWNAVVSISWVFYYSMEQTTIQNEKWMARCISNEDYPLMRWISHESKAGFLEQKLKVCEIKMPRDENGRDCVHMMMSCNKLKTRESDSPQVVWGLGQFNWSCIRDL